MFWPPVFRIDDAIYLALEGFIMVDGAPIIVTGVQRLLLTPCFLPKHEGFDTRVRVNVIEIRRVLD